MKQVIVNGVSYLGELVEAEGVTVLKDAMQTAGNVVSKNDVQRYMELDNLDQLQEVRFGGAGVNFTTLELPDDIVMAFEMGELVMKQAKRVAVRNLENAEFRSGLGKI